MSTNRPRAPATGAALVSLSARVSVPLTVAVSRVSSTSSLSVIHSSGPMSGARFVVPVRVLLAQPVELPVGIGEVLDGALVTWAGRVRPLSVQGAQVDRLEVVAIGGDAVSDAGEGPGVGGSLAVETAQDVDLDGAVGEAGGDDHEGGHVDVVDAGLALQGDGIGQLDA